MLSFLVPIFQLFQVLIATVASVFCFVISGITLGASVMGLALATPLFVIFSPILVPATITTTVLAGAVTGVTALSITAMTLLRWLLKDRMGVKSKNNPPPKGAPTKSDKPSINPEGNTPKGMAGGDKPGGMPRDQPGGMLEDNPEKQHRGKPKEKKGGKLEEMGGNKTKGKKGGKLEEMGGDKPKRKKEGKSEEMKGDKPKSKKGSKPEKMGGDKSKGKKRGKPEEMGGDKPKGKKRGKPEEMPEQKPGEVGGDKPKKKGGKPERKS